MELLGFFLVSGRPSYHPGKHRKMHFLVGNLDLQVLVIKLMEIHPATAVFFKVPENWKMVKI